MKKLDNLLLLLFLVLLSCKNENKIRDDDYKILNTVITRQIRDDAWNIMIRNEIDNKDSIYLDSELKKYGFKFNKVPSKNYFIYNKLYDSLLFYHNKFTYTIRDSMFKYNPNTFFSPQIELYIDVSNYKDDLKFDPNKLLLPSNCIRINSKNDTIKYRDHIYLGEYSLSRILFNRRKDGGAIIITNNYEGKDGRALYEILDKNERWVITN